MSHSGECATHFMNFQLQNIDLNLFYVRAALVGDLRMKKSLIALAALSAFATAAQAQSSVSVYGSIDAGWNDTDRKISNVGEVSKSSTSSGIGGAQTGTFVGNGALTASRLGFRGTEDLGGGLAANFNLEYQLQNGTGNTTVSNIRTSTVGLSSKQFGTFNVGRQLTGIHGVLTATSPLGGNNMAGDIQYSADGETTSDVSLRQHAYTNGVEAVRMSNSISYITPAFSGFTARVDYANDKSNTDTSKAGNDNKQDHLGLSANYTQGNLLVTAGTHTVKTTAANRAAVTGLYGTVSGTTITNTNTKPTSGNFITFIAPVTAIDATNNTAKYTTDAIAARYTMGALKLNVIYSEKEESQGAYKTIKQDAMQFGVSYDIGKVTLAGQYGEGSTKVFGAPTSTNYGDKIDNTAYQVAAIYNLSKRTNVYAAYGNEERKKGASPKDVSSIGDKQTRTQYAVGMRHSF